MSTLRSKSLAYMATKQVLKNGNNTLKEFKTLLSESTTTNDSGTSNLYYYVTGFVKTLRMGFFQKIEFDAWLISSTIELTGIQVLGQSCAWLWRYSALFAIAPHPQ